MQLQGGMLKKRQFSAMIVKNNRSGDAWEMSISAELRVLRERLLLTQEEFAKELGVAASTVNRWETGKSRPNICAMKAIKGLCSSKDYPFDAIEVAWITR